MEFTSEKKLFRRPVHAPTIASAGMESTWTVAGLTSVIKSIHSKSISRDILERRGFITKC